MTADTITVECCQPTCHSRFEVEAWVQDAWASNPQLRNFAERTLADDGTAKGPASCDTCCERHDAEEHDQADPWAIRWRELTPPKFWRGETATKIGHPGFPAAAWDRLRGREHSARGLYIQGDTGAGKSRLAFALLKRLVFREHLSCQVIDVGGLAALVEQIYRDRGDRATAMGPAKSCDILLLEDLGQERLTLRAGEVLFEIAKHREEHLMPTWATTQQAPTALADRFEDGDKGRGFARRIDEGTEYVPISTISTGARPEDENEEGF